jgi:hypothetical protein
MWLPPAECDSVGGLHAVDVQRVYLGSVTHEENATLSISAAGVGQCRSALRDAIVMGVSDALSQRR